MHNTIIVYCIQLYLYADGQNYNKDGFVVQLKPRTILPWSSASNSMTLTT